MVELAASGSGPGGRPSSAEEAFVLLLQLQESGRAVDFETWVSSFPEFERELRELNEEWLRIKPGLEKALAEAAGPDSPQVGGTTLAPALAPARAPAQPRPGARIGEFLLVRPIAQGGMGQVWEALQRPLGRVVALKLIRPDRIDRRTLALFEKEARAGGRMTDPRIVTVYATGESDGLRWIAEEYVVGERTLAQVLANDRKGPGRHAGDFERWARFFADVAEAMHSVHEVGVIHRDLKPGNILITADGGPKVTDFGLARVVDESSFSGQLAGTVHYMSPEQAESKSHAIDRRSDVFSLGTVLYEALARRRPFDGASAPEILIQISRRDPPDPRTLASDVPKELAWIALKALEKEPQRRYASMAEFAADLRRFLAHQPVRARQATKMERAAKWTRRHPTASVTTGLLVVLAVSVWGFMTAFAGQSQKALSSRMRQLVMEAFWYVDRGDLGKARAKSDEMLELAPANPTGDLVLAFALGSFGLILEAEEALQRAASKEFPPDQESDDVLQARILRALARIARPDQASRSEAERDLTAMAAENPEYSGVWFPLYQVRKFQRDPEGAAQALDAYRDTLPRGETRRTKMVDGLRAELRKEFEIAIKEFESLCATEPPEILLNLRVHKHLGRNYLLAYLKNGRTDASALASAESHVKQMLADVADDSDSLSALALIDLLRMRDVEREGERDRLLEDAEARALEAVEIMPRQAMGQEVLVFVAMHRAYSGFHAEDNPNEEELDLLERRLGDLDGLDPDSQQGREARSALSYMRAAIASARREPATALRLAQESVELDENQVRARVLLGGLLFIEHKDFAKALRCFQEARAVLERGLPNLEGDERFPWEPRWTFAIDVWLFGTAEKCASPDLELARQARERALAWLDADNEMDEEDQINLAEFLALPAHAELANCERALDIVEHFKLELHFHGQPNAETILASIRDACSR
jgi:tetratricopeptide (TPR) repeat protein